MCLLLDNTIRKTKQSIKGKITLVIDGRNIVSYKYNHKAKRQGIIEYWNTFYDIKNSHLKFEIIINPD